MTEIVGRARHTLAVIARLDRAIQYAEAALIESRSRGVLDAPLSQSMTPVVMRTRFAQRREPLARPAMIRAVKSSFTIRVDRLFTASRDDAFTNAQHRPVKTPVFA
ncbi:hypothetical protein [Bradyrhizobium sp. LVM 105]|uniref:hypothetical protein n=1 Tax=Bradyrhizobium sp. LVM 105 TaxID=2341115 RepID=UPI0013DF39D5|nr:hypothetical protein [Bradyrhizobium sp. LVM 105]